MKQVKTEKAEQVFSSAPLVASITNSYKLKIPGGLDATQLGWVMWTRQTWRGPLPAGSG